MSKLNKKLKENLGTEINILRDIRHPHIVGLFDCRETSKFIHLVMEWCPLGDLAHFMKHRHSFAEHPDFKHIFKKYPNNKQAGIHNVLARHFFQQLASAIAFLRSRSLIHRDIKPQNLLVVPQRSYYDKPRPDVPYFPSNWSTSEAVGVDSLPLLKLADFGFARWLPHTTMAETLCGSPLYMAPEILRYERYDAKADLWSVGAVTFEMMTGRPPFKAGNHVELLRKIEATQDNIKFPVEHTLNADMRRVVRTLLKMRPVERIGFEEFFADSVLSDDIPELAEEDRPQSLEKAEAPQGRLEVPSSEQRPSRRSSLRSETIESETQEKFHDAIDYPSSAPSRRPTIRETATAPPGQLAQAQRRQSVNDPPRASPQAMPPTVVPASSQTRREAIERRASRASLEQAREAAQQAREAREQQERAAQDVAFERDYVVVEKRAVEVNAFADEMAASPRTQNTGGRRESNPPAAALMRRNTTQNIPTGSAGTGNQLTSARIQLATGTSGKGPEHGRSGSYDRRGKGASTTSAISKAVAMASGRLMSFGLSPPLNLPLGLGRGTPSPPVYHPFPAYPASDPVALMLGDGKDNQPLDEDSRIRQAVEEAAHRSDVVYGFAEVKYKQLIPLAPSSEQEGLGLKGAGLSTPSKEVPGSASQDDDGLTVDAIVTLSEEALVLYVKALTLLAQSMNVAGSWWAKKQRGDLSGEDSSVSPKTMPGGGPSSGSSASAVRINKVVQWVRDRFNEVLEKAEFVRLKLIDAQKRLPPDHPSHPSNHSVASSAGTIGMSSDNVQVSPGVTAEKLMYTRALEMGRQAAVNELVGEDLPGCEISYVTAIRMLEAVVEGTDDGDGSRTENDRAKDTEGKEGQGQGDEDEVVEIGDRGQILNGEYDPI